MTPQRLKRHRNIYRMVGLLNKAGLNGDDIKSVICLDLSEGRTKSSTKLGEYEHRRLVSRMKEACEKAGIAADKPIQSKRERAPKGIATLRSKSQIKAIKDLAKRIGYSVDVIDDIIKKAPSGKQASAKINELKSLLVRNADMLNRSKAILSSATSRITLTGKENQVLSDLVATLDPGGRAVNRGKVGGICWSFDILDRYQKEATP